MSAKELTVTVGRISATRQGLAPGVSIPNLTLRGFHGEDQYAPPHDRLWPAAASVLCDELAKIRAALLAAKTLGDDPKDRVAKATLVRLLGELEVA